MLLIDCTFGMPGGQSWTEEGLTHTSRARLVCGTRTIPSAGYSCEWSEADVPTSRGDRSVSSLGKRTG